MKILITFVMCVLLFCLWLTSSRRTLVQQRSTASAALDRVLDAHGGRANIKAAAGFNAEFVRVFSGRAPAHLEQRVSLRVSGQSFERRITYPGDPTVIVERFDPGTGFKTFRSSGAKPVGSALSESETGSLATARSAIETSGLFGFLQKLSDDTTQATSSGQSDSYEEIAVQIRGTNWVLYSDRETHLIRKLVGPRSAAFEFFDYRSKNGLVLPFRQKVSLANRAVFELSFSSLDVD